jgi:hypothetical protein
MESLRSVCISNSTVYLTFPLSAFYSSDFWRQLAFLFGSTGFLVLRGLYVMETL